MSGFGVCLKVRIMGIALTLDMGCEIKDRLERCLQDFSQRNENHDIAIS